MNETKKILELFYNDKRIGGSKEPPLSLFYIDKDYHNIKLEEVIFYKPVEDQFYIKYKNMVFLNCEIISFDSMYQSSYKSIFNNIIIKSYKYLYYPSSC